MVAFSLDRDRPSRVSTVAHGALRGAIGSMAMTGVRTVTVSAGLVHQAPPQQIAGEAGGRRRAMIELGHWAFGAAGGATFAVLPAELRARSWTGPVYGLLIMAGFEAVAPMLGLGHRERAGLSDRLALAADHALYGLVLDETRARARH